VHAGVEESRAADESFENVRGDLVRWTSHTLGERVPDAETGISAGGGGYVCAAAGMAATADELCRVACTLAMSAAVLGAILRNTIARWIGAFFGGLGGGHNSPHLAPYDGFALAWL